MTTWSETRSSLEWVSSLPPYRNPFTTYLLSLFAANQYLCPHFSGFDAMHCVNWHLHLVWKSCSSTMMKSPDVEHEIQFCMNIFPTTEKRTNLFVFKLRDRSDFLSKRRKRKISLKWFLHIACLQNDMPHLSVQKVWYGMSSDPVTPRAHNSNEDSVMVLFRRCSSASFSITNVRRLQDFQPVCFYARNS